MQSEPTSVGQGGEGREPLPQDHGLGDWLPAFLRATVGDGRSGLRHHIDLNLGGFDEPSLEPVLFTLLGVTAECRLLLGISWLSAGDLEACRAEWGEPCGRVDLRQGTRSPLSWDIWRMPAEALVGETVAGSSLVLKERDPTWILYTDPAENIPMLFLSSEPCPVHS